MVKSKEDTITEFNEQVNMTAEELEKWLENPESNKAGTGVGLDSAAKIIEILKKNPTKDPSKYDDEDLEHMRKVVGYNKRHLAQEEHLKDTKSKEELEHAKSTISLKNWGHDPLKTLEGKATSDAKEKPGQEENAKSEKKPSKVDASKPSEDKEVGSKRKHDEATSEEPESKATDKENEGDEEAEGSSDDEDADDASGAERARKKSKTAADESEVTAEE